MTIKMYITYISHRLEIVMLVQVFSQWIMNEGAYAVRVEVYTNRIEWIITLFN